MRNLPYVIQMPFSFYVDPLNKIFAFFVGMFIICLLSLQRHNIFLKGLPRLAKELREEEEEEDWEVLG